MILLTVRTSRPGKTSLQIGLRIFGDTVTVTHPEEYSAFAETREVSRGGGATVKEGRNQIKAFRCGGTIDRAVGLSNQVTAMTHGPRIVAQLESTAG
jgi:hypothetical protein